MRAIGFRGGRTAYVDHQSPRMDCLTPYPANRAMARPRNSRPCGAYRTGGANCNDRRPDCPRFNGDKRQCAAIADAQAYKSQGTCPVIGLDQRNTSWSSWPKIGPDEGQIKLVAPILNRRFRPCQAAFRALINALDVAPFIALPLLVIPSVLADHLLEERFKRSNSGPAL